MCLVCGDVQLNRTPSGPGIRRGSGHHHGIHRHRQRQHRTRTVAGGVRTDTGGINAGSTVLPTNPRGADGLRAPETDPRPTATDHRPADETVPASAVRSHRTRTTDTDPEERTRRSLEEASGPRNQRRPATGTGRYDPGRTAIWRGSPRFEDAVRECFDVSSQGGPSCSPGPRGQRPEISRLPGLFRVGSNSVERLDCSTPNGHTTQTRQLSRRTVDDAVRIQSAEGNRLRTDLATRPGGRDDRAGRPTSFCTTPGSSFWGPRLSNHRRMENAGD
jgi:hypothetical protein